MTTEVIRVIKRTFPGDEISPETKLKSLTPPRNATRLEVLMEALERYFGISINPERLQPLRTVHDVEAYILERTTRRTPRSTSDSYKGNTEMNLI